MTKEIKKYTLNFDDALSYFRDNLGNINELSKFLLEIVNFNEGNFYTLLPPDANFFNLNKFKCGRTVSGIDEIWCNFIFHKLKNNEKFLAIFDDFNASFDKNHDDDLFLNNGKVFNNEVYYEINSKNATPDKIKNFLNASNTIWHSLCVLAETAINPHASLSNQDIVNVCENTHLIMIVAYDDEGYIFWERTEGEGSGLTP